MMAFSKGDICLVNFNPAKGGEMGKLRPAIILSNNEDNEILETVVVIPLSTVIEPNAAPYRLNITKRDKLFKPSDACVYEIRALSKTRVKEKLSAVTDNELKTLNNYLCKILN